MFGNIYIIYFASSKIKSSIFGSTLGSNLARKKKHKCRNLIRININWSSIGSSNCFLFLEQKWNHNFQFLAPIDFTPKARKAVWPGEVRMYKLFITFVNHEIAHFFPLRLITASSCSTYSPAHIGGYLFASGDSAKRPKGFRTASDAICANSYMWKTKVTS
jgi:hypothetical protein